MKKILKKVLSMLITLSLLVGIANIPAYSATAISPAKTGDGYALQAEYKTPAQMVKKVETKKTTKPAAKKTTTTKKKTAKKIVKKSVSLTSKIIKKYTKTGLTVLKTVAKKLNLTLKSVYNSFVKMGVTKAQIKKISTTFLNMIKRGVRISNCASLAVAKYLGIKTNLAAAQNLAADISLNVDQLVKDFKKEKDLIATYTDAEEKVLKKNGRKRTNTYDNITLKEFISGLKVGEKALLYVECFDGGGHAITVQREKKGFAVYDVMVDDGAKRVYNTKEFKKLMSGKKVKAKCKNSKGKNTTTTVYFKAVINKKLSDGFVITDSKGTAKKDLEKTTAYKYAKQKIASINKLLKSSKVSKLAKTWLTKAKALFNSIINSNKTNSEKKRLLADASNAIADVINQNASILSLVKCSLSKVFNSFSSLKSILKNDLTYKIYNKYDENGLNAITELSKRYNLSQKVVYNQFVNNKVTKTQMQKVGADIVYLTKNGWEVLDSAFGEGYKEVENTLASIKQLLNK